MTDMTVGTSIENPGTEVSLLAKRFSRHTFWTGQSGSGKTYALGVVLEQLLLSTRLPLLILDPNADFTRLTEVRPEAEGSDADRITGGDIRILHSTRDGGERLRTRFMDLSTQSKAAVLQLHPISDPEEYNVLLHTDADPNRVSDADFLAGLRASHEPGQVQLATRIENLQILEWSLWARAHETVNDIIDTRPRATVLDLGGFSHPAEPKVAALSVLEHLWVNRHARKPILIVIDEAHNLCSPNPSTPVERALLELIIQIAAEGRKFGLWLLLSTQRPTKIHPNILSQCDNLCLMKMNSPRDLAEIAEVFGFVPAEMLAQSPSFTLGQALFAGGFIESPTLTQMGARFTVEGGSDVAVPM